MIKVTLPIKQTWSIRLYHFHQCSCRTLILVIIIVNNHDLSFTVKTGSQVLLLSKSNVI